MNNVFFISDTHIKHENILRYQTERIKAMGLKDETDIESHDNYIIDMFLNEAERGDHVYVLGDMILSNQQESLKVLNKIKSKGCILHLITGNHDRSTQRMFNMFESIDLIKVLNFKKSQFPFLEEEYFQCVCCHYPIISWFNKARGSAMLHGHTHSNSPWENEGDDLRFNVGLDAPLANYHLISLEALYKAYKAKLGGLSPKDYIEKCTEENPHFIR